MNRLYTMLIVLSILSTSAAEISGRVYDMSGTIPICSAAVRLENGKSNVFTDTEGKFVIDIASVGICDIHSRYGQRMLQVTFHNRTISVNVAGDVLVEFLIHDLSGKQVLKYIKHAHSGICSFVLPILANGMVFYTIKSGDNRVAFRNIAGQLNSFIPVVSAATPDPAHDSRNTGVFKDILEIRKAGYLTNRSMIMNSDTTGILVKLLPGTATVKDADSNIYEAVTIGTQTWMTENLRTTRYNDGSKIPTEINNNKWSNLRSAAYCWYEHDSVTIGRVYGGLYNWYAVGSGKLAPVGWHVATDSEWLTLVSYFGGEEIAGGKLKEVGTTHWNWPGVNALGTDDVGFSALPGGFRAYVGTFTGINLTTYLWTSSGYNDVYAWSRCVSQGNHYVSRYTSNKWLGFSVRCVRD